MRSFRYTFLKKIGVYTGQGYVAPNPSLGDIYLVEYPKSGVTFLSQMMASFFCEQKITFFNVHRFVLDIHTTQITCPPSLGTSQIRLIKSHSEANSNYRTVIYLFRNPLEVLVSYYNYFCDFYGYTNSFSKFIRSHRGVVRWVGHGESWLMSDHQIRFFPVSYNKLVSDPLAFLERFSQFCGMPSDSACITKAIEESKKDVMLAQEMAWGYGGRNYSAGMRNASFIGKKKFTISDVDVSDQEYIEMHCGPTYELLLEAESIVFASERCGG